MVYCQSLDFKSPIGPTKNLERHYNQVVVCSVGCLFATLVITTSSHSKCCPADQTRQDKFIKMIKMIKRGRLPSPNLDRPIGWRSNGPSMLCLFGLSKWTRVQWTAYVTSIWTVQMTTVQWTVHVTSIRTVQMDDSLLDHRPFGQSIGPPT